MIGVPVTTWHACTRCAHGRHHGLHCAHPNARRSAHQLLVPVDHVRSAGAQCGPDGRWHHYAAPSSLAIAA